MVLYTSIGGLLADAWTDLVQGIAIIVGLLALVVVLVVSGDLQAAWQQVPAERLALLGDGSVPWYELLEAWTVPVVGSMLAVELLSRVFGCESAATARRACFVGGGLYLVVGAIPALLGLCGPYLVPGLEDAEQLVPALASRHLGQWLYVPFAGALISAILSTVDSCMLAGSTLVTHNVLLPIWPDLSERAKLRASRLGVLTMGVCAWALALRTESIKDLVETASAFGSAGVFVVACFGLFTAIGGPLSAWVGLCTGFVVWIAGATIGWPAPYVTALAASVIAYLVTAPFSSGAATVGRHITRVTVAQAPGRVGDVLRGLPASARDSARVSPRRRRPGSCRHSDDVERSVFGPPAGGCTFGDAGSRPAAPGHRSLYGSCVVTPDGVALTRPARTPAGCSSASAALARRVS